jgi:hypothetical protein
LLGVGYGFVFGFGFEIKGVMMIILSRAGFSRGGLRQNCVKKVQVATKATSLACRPGKPAASRWTGMPKTSGRISGMKKFHDLLTAITEGMCSRVKKRPAADEEEMQQVDIDEQTSGQTAADSSDAKHSSKQALGERSAAPVTTLISQLSSTRLCARNFSTFSSMMATLCI